MVGGRLEDIKRILFDEEFSCQIHHKPRSEGHGLGRKSLKLARVFLPLFL